MSMFAIREKKHGTFLISQKNIEFSSDIDSAALFVSEKNAKTAMRKLEHPWSWAAWNYVNNVRIWYWRNYKTNESYLTVTDLDTDNEVETKKDFEDPDMEVVEIILSVKEKQ